MGNPDDHSEAIEPLPINLVISRVTHFLLGTDWPATRHDLFNHAIDHGADPGSLTLIKLLPMPQYADIKRLRLDISRTYRRLIAKPETIIMTDSDG